MPNDIDTSINLKFHVVTADQVRQCLADSLQHNLQPIEDDSEYRAMREDDWHKALSKTSVAWKRYKPEEFDCDDFACCQKALLSMHFDLNGCGQVFDESGGHSYNVILVTDKHGQNLHTRIVEPQKDAEIPYSMVGTGHYAERQGFIVI